MIKVCHFDEDSATTCKFIKFMKFISMMKIYQTNCINLIIFGLVINLNNSDLLCFALNSYFLTFPGGGGWLGWGKSRLKTISVRLKLKLGLSLQKTKPIFAVEIGSNIYTILEKIISMSWKEKLTHQNQRILICLGAVT